MRDFQIHKLFYDAMKHAEELAGSIEQKMAIFQGAEAMRFEALKRTLKVKDKKFKKKLAEVQAEFKEKWEQQKKKASEVTKEVTKKVTKEEVPNEKG